MRTIEPLEDRVLVRVIDPVEERTASGILIPDTAREKPHEAIVVAVGSKEEGMPVKPGDRVIFAKYSGVELKLNGISHLLLERNDLLALVRDTAEQDGAV
jgi:chaperonin GroES